VYRAWLIPDGETTYALTKKEKMVADPGYPGFNLDIPSLFKGQISQVKSKGICLPVLNCYSCPAAIGACPIGSLQNAFDSLKYNLSLGQKNLAFMLLAVLAS